MEVYCLAHGVDVTQFDVFTYKEMLYMYAHGFIGNRKIIEIMAAQLSAIYGYMSGGKKSYSMRDLLGDTWDFWVPPKTIEEYQKENEEKTKMHLNHMFMMYGGAL